MNKNEKFRELITYLDCALTGKPYKHCLHTYDCVPRSPEEFLDGSIYYLSDDGYSRLDWDHVYGKGVYITNESSNNVKEAFKRCSELVSDLNAFLYPIYEK
jgi:hypothetical protein